MSKRQHVADTKTGNALAHQREGFAVSLSRKLFGHVDPNVVQFFYDWQVQAAQHGATVMDPFNFHHKGEYRTQHDALVGAVHELHAPRFQLITRDLHGGFTDQARQDIAHKGIRLGNQPLPDGSIDESGNIVAPGIGWSGHVGRGIGDVGHAGAAVGKGAADAAKGLGDIFGGLSVPMLLVILVVVMVVLKK